MAFQLRSEITRVGIVRPQIKNGLKAALYKALAFPKIKSFYSGRHVWYGYDARFRACLAVPGGWALFVRLRGDSWEDFEVSQKNNGGPAFPPLHDPHTHQSGMTLRDYFAAKAMQGFVAATGHRDGRPVCIDDARFAERSYEVADAMLEARGACFLADDPFIGAL